jgi:hypothetical protein
MVQEHVMAVKVFSLQEANAQIPTVEKAILWLKQAVKKIVQTQDSASVLELLGGPDPKSPENREWLRKQVILEDLIAQYNDRLEALQKLGCVIKDLEHGVVDFYGTREGRLIFFCWRLGEKSIRFWHEIDSGMMGRRPLSEL